MIEITAVRMSGGRHEHITDLRWRNPTDGEVGVSTRTEMVHFLAQQNGQAYVKDGIGAVEVHVVQANPPYVQTYRDGRWTDNLLALPRFN